MSDGLIHIDIDTAAIEASMEIFRHLSDDANTAMKRMMSDMRTRGHKTIKSVVQGEFPTGGGYLDQDFKPHIAGLEATLEYTGQRIRLDKFDTSPGAEPPRTGPKVWVPREHLGYGGTGMARVSLPATYTITAAIKSAPASFSSSTRHFVASNGHVVQVIDPSTSGMNRQVKPVYTVASPQMITSPNVKGEVEEKLSELIEKRLENHLKPFFG